MRHPEWIGIRDNGQPCNYIDNDFYLNGYDPEVQGFLMDLMKEAVAKYPGLDGGGSSMLLTGPEGTLHNSPSDGKQRKVLSFVSMVAK